MHLLIRIRRPATLGKPGPYMALTKTANLMLLLLLAGSTDAFATPRRARGLVVTRGGSVDLPPTKPKPFMIELSVDVGIVAATLGLFRRAGCIHAKDCSHRVVLGARLFFAVANSILIALYASALRYARRLPASSVVTEDISFMEDRMRKSLFKIAVVLGLHLKFDLMPPLIVFSLVHWVAQPLWWDKETSYYRKYGLGRNGGPRAFGVARNIWIYTKEFMMPRKL